MGLAVPAAKGSLGSQPGSDPGISVKQELCSESRCVCCRSD